MRIDTDEVEKIEAPLERALAADTMLATAERLTEYLRNLRAAAMRTHARNVGGFQAADDLDMNRASMYRAIRKGVSSAQVELDEVHWQQEASKLNVRLRMLGLSKDDVDRWWNLKSQPALGGRTPLQAWNAGERDAVVTLVHSIGG